MKVGYANYIRIHIVKVDLVKGEMSSDKEEKITHRFVFYFINFIFYYFNEL